MADPILVQVGSVFGWFTVVEPHGDDWVCLCVCGNSRVLTATELIAAEESTAWFASRPKRNGRGAEIRTPEYRAWQNMLQRCTNKTLPNYKDYGGRGIIVAPQWHNYDRFLADVGRRPSKTHSLEREDNNGNYVPGNVVWATREKQTRNRRTNRFLTHNGETLVITDWAKRTGISVGTIKARIKKGWSVQDILETPIDPSCARDSKEMREITHGGETLTVRQWAERIGLGYSALTYRIREWGVEKALTTPVDGKQQGNSRSRE